LPLKLLFFRRGPGKGVRMIIGALVLFFILMFFLFVFIFKKVINKNISSAVSHLDKINQDYLKKQEEAEKKLEEAERIYQEKVSQAKEEALSLREEILKQTEREKEEIINKAKEQAKEIISQAEKTRRMLITEIEQRISKEAVKKAGQLLGEALSENIRKIIHNNLVKEFIEGLSKKIGSLDIPQDLSEVKVRSSFELTSEEKDSFIRIFQKISSQEAEVVFEKDSKLIAGVIVALGSLIIDGSLQFKIRERIKELEGE